ncbi:unnamed protein product [Rhizoctonia solani]|uniref:18S rRNA factor 2 n=1 Tax=Rhizoctonia solani TaxID=456999 RepID=A0A8H3EAM5_9AGAM|nr:unnamed protein product [Rhizoctonia solani]
MLRLYFVFAATVASMVSALPANITGTRRTCGSVLSAVEMVTAEKYFDVNKPNYNMDSCATNLKVYWHVISADNTLEHGNIPDSQIKKSLDVLNKDYGKSGLSFSLAGVDRTVNNVWFNEVGPDSQLQTDMKKALRKGGPYDLNVYNRVAEKVYLDMLPSLSSYKGNPEDDGVVILYSSVPGGGAAPYNLGKSSKTLTHEVGHWVGLYHTFEGGCDLFGDGVLDTPPEAGPAFGCPKGRDTCTKSLGADPIHNFMDYTDDACMDEPGSRCGYLANTENDTLNLDAVEDTVGHADYIEGSSKDHDDSDPENDDNASQETTESSGEEDSEEHVFEDEGTQPLDKTVQPLSGEALAKFEKAQQKAGIIYISRIPPGMRPAKVKHLMSNYGKVGRVFLQQEDPKRAYLRKKHTATKKVHYTEGWVEFESKHVARSVAEMLNAQPVGGKKGTRWRDDIWTMKYLPKFKWNMLTEQVAQEAAAHTARLRVELSQSKAEQRDYLRNVELARVLEKRAQRKRKSDSNEVEITKTASNVIERLPPTTKKARTQSTDLNNKRSDGETLNNVLSSIF